MPIKIQTQITYKDIYDFLLYHNYCNKVNGIIVTLLSFFGIGLGAYHVRRGDIQSAMISFMVGAFLLIYTPQTLRAKAKFQVKNTPMFQNPLNYEFSEQGITTMQDENQVTHEWSDYAKAVTTRRSIILYLNTTRAVIFPKKCLGDQYGEILKLISTHMQPDKVKIRHVR